MIIIHHAFPFINSAIIYYYVPVSTMLGLGCAKSKWDRAIHTAYLEVGGMEMEETVPINK